MVSMDSGMCHKSATRISRGRYGYAIDVEIKLLHGDVYGSIDSGMDTMTRITDPLDGSAAVIAEGIWTGEIFGPYGWENSGVYVLENGRIVGGNNRHYSTGSYRVSGTDYEAVVDVHYYGPPRTVFGEALDQFKIEVKGKLEDGVIDAQAIRGDRPEFNIHYRMIKRMGLPPA